MAMMIASASSGLVMSRPLPATGLKDAFGRARPSQGNNPNLWFQGSGHQSFPSGEVTLQASFVTPFIVNYAADNPWVWALEALPAYDAVARVKSGLILKPIQNLADGSYLAQIYRSCYDRLIDRGGIVVRVIRYTLDDPQRVGHGEVHRRVGCNQPASLTADHARSRIRASPHCG